MEAYDFILQRLVACAGRRCAKDDQIVGLGSGSTALHVVSILGQRVSHGLRIIGIPISEQTGRQAHHLGIPLSTLAEHDRIDVTIDGAARTACGRERRT